MPSTAVNTTELWQADTFDAETVDRELGWAQGIGFNTCRVFIQYLVWHHDLLKRDGTPYRTEEVAFVRRFLQRR